MLGGSHPWDIPKLSLVTLRGAPSRLAGDDDVDGHERGAPREAYPAIYTGIV